MTGRTSLVTIPLPTASQAMLVAPAATPVVSPRSAVADVTVRLRRVRAHLDGRHARYELRVGNRAACALLATTYAFRADRSGETAAPVSLTVPGRASLETTFLLELPRKRPFRAVTQIRLANETFVVEETARSRPHGRFVFLCGLALAAASALLAQSGFWQPSVTALAAPGHVRASRSFPVAYALARAQGAGYTVVAAGGGEAARGTLPVGGSSFEIALPASKRPTAYDIRLSAHSRFGDTARSVRVVADPEPTARAIATVRRPVVRAKPFAIDRLSLGSETVAGGKPLVVYYGVSSVDGTLRLIDQYGTVRAEALINRRGNSILLAPYVEADQDLRVVLHAARGDAQAEQSVSVRVTRAHSLDDVLAAARRSNNGPIALVTQQVAAGEQIRVGIVQYEPGMRVALVDPDGLEVAASAVFDDQNEVSLTAPAIAGPARYTVTATYKKGQSEETVIRNVTIGGSAPNSTSVDRTIR